MANYKVPGLYATIEDYNLISLETPQSLSENAIVLFGDLPDFVYVPDENSTDVNAVKRVRISPNTIIPITNVQEAINSLTGANILDGILTQAQKDELICKDMITALKLGENSATAGELAIVKIVKRDGNRPDTNNKFEVFQALQNTYEKLGNVKCSQIIPVGIAGDDDFVDGDEKQPEMIIRQPETEYGAVEQDKVFNDIYNFNPVEAKSNIKVEFALEKTDFLNTESTSEEATLVKTHGLDAPEVAHLFKGKVLVDGVVKATGVELEFKEDKFLSKVDVNVPVVEGEANVALEAGTIFATLKTTTNDQGKKVAVMTGGGMPALNFYEREKVIPEIADCNISATTCSVGDDIVISGTLKETPNEFNTRIETPGFDVKQAVDLDFDDPELKTFKGILTAKEEGTHKIVFTLTAPSEEKPFEWEITVGAATARKRSTVRAVARKAREIEYVDGINQHVFIDIVKATSNWIQITNEGNLKETVDKIAVLEGTRDGVEQYNPTTAGTYKLEFFEEEDKCIAVISDPAEEKEEMEFEIEVKEEEGAKVVAKATYLKLADMTIVLYSGLVVVPVAQSVDVRRSVYFDAKSDTITRPVYVINYVPADAENIMESLKYVKNQINAFSEVLMVWGVRPPSSVDPNTIKKYAQALVNTPKFQKGFKVRTSATKETDLGAFLSVVVGTIKSNGVGGISNFDSYRVVDFERNAGGSGTVKPMTDKLFVELTNDFSRGTNVEIRTYVGVKEKVVEAIVLSTKEVLGRTMITLDTEIDTSVFDLDGFEIMISNTDSKDRHGSFAAVTFAIQANQERDRAPIQQDITGTADVNFSQEMLELLGKNKFTVISKNLITGNGLVVDTPTMARTDSDFQSRSSIGALLALLKQLRKVADTKKGKRFPKKEDKVMLEEDLRSVFKNEMDRSDSLITAYEFAADMSKLDTKGYLSVKFRIRDARKLEVVEFAGGLAKLNS